MWRLPALSLEQILAVVEQPRVGDVGDGIELPRKVAVSTTGGRKSVSGNRSASSGVIQPAAANSEVHVTSMLSTSKRPLPEAKPVAICARTSSAASGSSMTFTFSAGCERFHSLSTLRR